MPKHPMPKHSPSAALLLALDDIGGLTAMAKKLDVSRQRLAYWLEHGVPWREIDRVEKVTGLRRHQIRPDMYPPELEKNVARR